MSPVNNQPWAPLFSLWTTPVVPQIIHVQQRELLNCDRVGWEAFHVGRSGFLDVSEVRYQVEASLGHPTEPLRGSLTPLPPCCWFCLCSLWLQLCRRRWRCWSRKHLWGDSFSHRAATLAPKDEVLAILRQTGRDTSYYILSNEKYCLVIIL